MTKENSRSCPRFPVLDNEEETSVVDKRSIANTFRTILFHAGISVTLFSWHLALTAPVEAKDQNTTLSVALFDGCPFICPDESGPFVEGLKAALAGTQYDLEFKRIPFARAVKDLQSGKLDILPGILKDSIDGAIFPESWLYFTRMCFFSRAEDDWTWKDLPSLENRSIAVEKGIVHTLAFFDYVQDNKSVIHLSGDDILKRQLQMLELGRIQSFTAEQTVLAHYLKQNNLPPDKVQNAGCFEPEFEYVAISAKHPKAAEIRAVLTKGLEAHNKTVAPDLL